MIRNNYILIVLFLLIGLFGISSCVHQPIIVGILPIDTSGTGGGNNGGGGGNNGGGSENVCDPDTVYFQNDILPLLVSNCAMSGCHDAATHEEDIVTDSYSNIMNTLEIEPYHPNEGKLIELITETDPDKIMPPPPNDPLTSEQIAMIQTWILQGAQNNWCDANAGGCDTINVTYSLVLAPILETYCVGCHSGSTPSGGIDLSFYNGVSTVALDGRLSGAVTHNTGYAAMPPSGNGLSDCEIKQIEVWIDSGAPNN